MTSQNIYVIRQHCLQGIFVLSINERCVVSTVSYSPGVTHLPSWVFSPHYWAREKI